MKMVTTPCMMPLAKLRPRTRDIPPITAPLTAAITPMRIRKKGMILRMMATVLSEIWAR